MANSSIKSTCTCKLYHNDLSGIANLFYILLGFLEAGHVCTTSIYMSELEDLIFHIDEKHLDLDIFSVHGHLTWTETRVFSFPTDDKCWMLAVQWERGISHSFFSLHAEQELSAK